MIYYIYDGTFEGLLTSIFDAYYSAVKPEEICGEWEFEPTLLTQPVYISTDSEKSTKVYSAIRNKISTDALKQIYYAYLSDLNGASNTIYNYVKLGFKLGRDVDLHLHNDVVLSIHNINKKVTNECHRMLGFIRFKHINNFYYSSIEPDHNILGLIASHFAARLPNENFVIHDLKRELAVFYNKNEWVVSPLSKEKAKVFFENNEDEFYETLWKEFFKTIAVENRTNPKLQKRSMPVRYWKHLTELKQENN